eukprot:COSAG01_NODE_4621_length_4872_cov_3.265451_3_plen_84_part_00
MNFISAMMINAFQHRPSRQEDTFWLLVRGSLLAGLSFSADALRSAAVRSPRRQRPARIARHSHRLADPACAQLTPRSTDAPLN